MGPKIALDIEHSANNYQDEDILTSKDQVQSVEREGRISSVLGNVASELSTSKKNLISYNETDTPMKTFNNNPYLCITL